MPAARSARVVRDELVRSAGDPGEVADAQLVSLAQGSGDQKTTPGRSSIDTRIR
jgi:hypothetical protein